MSQASVLTGRLETVLLDLADRAATGCLHVRDEHGDEAEIYLRDGLVYAVSVPGRRMMLGARLLSSGALTPEALAEALRSSALSCRAGGSASCWSISATPTAAWSSPTSSNSSRTA